jgi:hypothetical protein
MRRGIGGGISCGVGKWLAMRLANLMTQEWVQMPTEWLM